MEFYLATSQLDFIFRLKEVFDLQAGVQEKVAEEKRIWRIKTLNIFSFAMLVISTITWLGVGLSVFKDKNFYNN